MADSPPPTDLVGYSQQAGVAHIQVDNPPVNSLSRQVRKELITACRRVAADNQVKAAVLSTRGPTFIAGADLKEFGTKPKAPKLPQVVAELDRLDKPVVALIDGAALGGGLEIALACSYLLVSETAKLGLPEINLGLLPGAGGTQRLPRLIGMSSALEMISGGRPVDAARALVLGIVDELAQEGDILEIALERARELAAAAKVRRISALRVDARGSESAVAEYLAKAKSSPLPAARYCVKACAASLLPFEQGLKRERSLFLAARRSQQHKAKLHCFFAERSAARAARTDTGPPVRSAAVIGAGAMGSGIAACLAAAGIDCRLIEANKQALADGMARIAAIFASRRGRGKISEQQEQQSIALVRPGGYQDMADVQLVIEAVPEVMKIKLEVFRRLSELAPPEAVLATNTSALDVDEIAGCCVNPERVIGMHFFIPAQTMRLLEVVRASATSEAVVARVFALAKRIKKAPVLVRNSPGFIGNRLYGHYGREAEFLLEEGASPQQVDRAMRSFGMAMGPFTIRDISGIDVGQRIREDAWRDLPREFPRPGVLSRLFAAGRLGVKSGAGYYRYEQGSKETIIDRRVLAHIEDAAAERGISRGKISRGEIVERCVYALVNEGAKALEEGAARCGGDIDMIFVTGYGFPSWRGGPMHHADAVGLDRVLEQIKRLNDSHGAWWRPAPLLERLAREGGSLSGFQN